MSIIMWIKRLLGQSLVQKAELDRMKIVEEERRRDEQTDKVMVVERPRSRFDEEISALEKTINRQTLHLQSVLQKYQNKSQELERLKQLQDRSLLQAHESILVLEDQADELSRDLSAVTEKLRIEREYGKSVARQCDVFRRLYEKSKVTVAGVRVRMRVYRQGMWTLSNRAAGK